MITRISGGKVIAEGKILPKDVYIKDKKIIAVTDKVLPFDMDVNVSGKYVSPGFIDIHTHGAGGSDFLDGTETAYKTAVTMQAHHGCTAVVPTATSGDLDELMHNLDVFSGVKNFDGGAKMMGLHLEGPYFSPEMCGAQDTRYLRDPKREEYERILERAGGNIIRWSAAPERKGSEEFAKVIKGSGVLPSIGHSSANGDEVRRAFDAGFTHVTHLYSCTSTITRKNGYRSIGIVEAAYLIDAMTVEIIADGSHLPADLLKYVYKFKGADRTVLVTDSMRSAGMGDGESVLGSLDKGLAVIVEDKVAKLPDRSAFAGSVATCDVLVRNMVKLAEVSLCDSVKMASETPARVMRFSTKGRLCDGFDADIVVFDEDINVSLTMVEGKTVYKEDEKV